MRGGLMRRANRAAVVALTFAPVAAQAAQSFHELNLQGHANAVGLTIVSVRQGTAVFDLEVNRAVVSARSRTDPVVRLNGTALVGLVIDLRNAAGRELSLRFDAVGETTFWADPLGASPHIR